MYDFVDRPVARLGQGSRFTLWAIRVWTRAMLHDRCPRTAMGGGFVTHETSAALPDFHATMMRLCGAGSRLGAIGPVGCGRIADGEAVMLALWADVARGEYDRALAVLRLVAPAPVAGLIGESMAGAVDHLRAAGLQPSGFACRGSVQRVDRGQKDDE